ncbi:hypothetical protein H0E84_12580 [Luteimonas sp. SJ-92]|uniref:Secreted protein n=1 Tax=Luteimonas salinisoli TaxID=2752307 RepID=A0A853JFG2_9GAMM|nr:hypothetical protein [Luteimonas salinisoli]NZA27218.1 hypothetical protein [Luteimonas salinisoli]
MNSLLLHAISILCLLVTGACSAPPVASPTLPEDVRSFVAERDLCDHFRGEVPDPEDRQRMDEVISAIDRHCTGTDARLDALRAKYADRAEILSRLAPYESGIEAR